MCWRRGRQGSQSPVRSCYCRSQLPCAGDFSRCVNRVIQLTLPGLERLPLKSHEIRWKAFRNGATIQSPQGNGEVAEWPNAPVSKTGMPERASRVRISPSPLINNTPAATSVAAGVCVLGSMTLCLSVLKTVLNSIAGSHGACRRSSCHGPAIYH